MANVAAVAVRNVRLDMLGLMIEVLNVPVMVVSPSLSKGQFGIILEGCQVPKRVRLGHERELTRARIQILYGVNGARAAAQLEVQLR